MVNQINFEENKPFNGQHLPCSLEGHFQPWYDDRRDYGTNAPSYYDYLSNFNGLIKSIVDFVNELAKRDVNVEDSNTVQLIKKASWLVDTTNEIILQAKVKISNDNDNITKVKEDGVYTPKTQLVKTQSITLAETVKNNKFAIKGNVNVSEQAGNQLSIKNDGLYVTQRNVDELLEKVEQLKSSYESLKARVDLLDGGGWATKEQLEELRKIIEANREDYENADSGLRLLIANMNKRLDALDGLSSEMDTWNEKVKVLEAEQLNVKNIATMAGTLVGAMTSYGYTKSEVNTTTLINNKDRFVVLYNSFTQRINGRITRLERVGFDYSGITTAGKTVDPVTWTQLGEFTIQRVEADYKGKWSTNLTNQIHNYAFRYYQNYFQNPIDALIYPWMLRLDYGTDGKFTVWSRGLRAIGTKGDISKPITEEVYTVVTWLDDDGNEYLPKYKANGDPEPLENCDRVVPFTPTGEEALTNDEGIRIIEHEGKKYFSDEFEQGILTHPLDFEEEETETEGE